MSAPAALQPCLQQVSPIENITQLPVYYYDYISNSYLQSGFEYFTFTYENDVADCSGLRSEGSYGNQFGVVPGYPDDPNTQSCDGTIKLFFNKEQPNPQIGFIKVITDCGGSDSNFQISSIICPGDVPEPPVFKYFRVDPINNCNASNDIITNTIRVEDNLGFETGKSVVMGNVGTTLFSLYILSEVLDITGLTIQDSGDFDIVNGPFDTQQEY